MSAENGLNNDSEYIKVKPQILNFFVTYWNLHGIVLTAEKANEEYGIPVGLVTKALKDEEFIAALVEQGVVFRKDDWLGKGLTTTQLLVANSLLDLTDSRSEKKKLQDLQIATTTYQSWLKDPVFKEYLHTRSEQLLGEYSHEAQQALRDRIRAGDLKAIEYYNEMRGIYTRPRSNSYGINGTDVNSIIVKIIEIVDEEVLNTEIKLRIAERLKTLVARQNLANELTGTISPVGELEAS